MLNVAQVDVATMKELAATGDIKLEEVRAKFKHYFQRDTTLDDDKLFIALAGQTDDDDTELVENIHQVEKGEYQIRD